MFKNISNHTKALFAIALISITWGTTWLPSKMLVGDNGVPPMEISSFRMMLAGIVFSAFFIIKGHKRPSITQLAKIAFLSIFFIVFANAFSLKALAYKTIGSGIGAVLAATVPLWVALLSMFVFKKQKMTIQILTGLFFGFGGIVIIFSKDLHVFTKAEYFEPIIYSSAASIAWALGTLLNAKKDNTINPFFKMGLQLFIGGFMLFVWSYFSEKQLPINKISTTSWLYFAYLVVIGSFISFATYIFALKHLPATQVATYAYINPIVALILGHFSSRNEEFTWYILIGTLVTLIGVYLVNLGFEKQRFKL